MSETPGSGAAENDSPPTQAQVTLTRAPRWVWLIPVAAIAVVGFLVVRALAFGGKDIVVRFVDAHGVREESTVRWRGVPVGEVRSVRIAPDEGGVEMRISIDASVADMLREGARFWVVEPDFSGGQLPSMLAGSFVAFEPGKGDAAKVFRGLEAAPVAAPVEPGRTFVLRTSDAGSLSAGTSVRYRGVTVGSVSGLVLEDGGAVRVHIFLPEKHASLVREGSRFWTSEGLSLSTEGGLGLKLPSLGSLVQGAISFDSPELFAGGPAQGGQVFELFDSRGAAETDMPGATARYTARLPGPLDGLGTGAAVELAGLRVGRVREVRLAIDPATAEVRARALLDLDARRLGLDVTGTASREEVRSRVDALVAALVARGLRARVSSGVIPGSAGVSLEVVEDAPPARLVTGRRDPPEIPAVEPGGLGGALASVGGAAGPVAKSVRKIAARVEEIVCGDEVRRSLSHVERSLAGLEGVATAASEGAGPIVRDLRGALASVETAARKVERMLGSTAVQGEGISDLVKELTRASQAVRELSSYLARHPESFVTGRKGQ